MLNEQYAMAVPEKLKNLVVLHENEDKPGSYLACIPATQNGNSEVQAYLAKLLKQPNLSVELKSMPIKEFETLTKNDVSHSLPLPSQNTSEVQRRVINLFLEAQRAGASDIHFNIQKDSTVLEMRINGLLWPLNPMSRDEGESMVKTIYHSMCDISDNMFKDYVPQDARLKQTFLEKAKLFGARYAHINTPNGVFAVMRLIPDDGRQPPTFKELGFLPEQITQIRRMLHRPGGIIINSGPTGSGKSTSGRSFIHYWLQITNGQRRVITQEDPVEGEVAGCIHSSVTADKASEDNIEKAWLRGRRAMLRLDPDSVYIGEIRDHDSAMAAINFAESGHLVSTTQHASSPLGNLNRLQILGVASGWLRSSKLFTGLIAQRLLPTLCPECALTLEDAQLTDEQIADIHAWFSIDDLPRLRFRNPTGCPNCIMKVMDTKISQGLKGRTAAAEIMRTTPEILRIYHEEGEDAARSCWIKQGGISLSQHAKIYILQGRVDPRMANEIVPLDDKEEAEVTYGH